MHMNATWDSGTSQGFDEAMHMSMRWRRDFSCAQPMNNGDERSDAALVTTRI
jgi:hypothetical protein